MSLSVNGERPAAHGDRRLPHVVIIGAGFAGLNAANKLRKAPVRVTIVDRHNYHNFQPLLYQVATSALNPDDVARNVRENYSRHHNISFRLGRVIDIDLDAKEVHTKQGSKIPYDYLIVAAGAVTNYFGIEGADQHALPLKDLSDAISLRDHILLQFERASLDPDLIDEGGLNFVIVGGGPTGVETAGALVELFDVMQDDFPELNTEEAAVYLVEMEDHLLPGYRTSLREYTERVLEQRGVRVKTGTVVERLTGDTVHFKSGESLRTNSLIWAAGVQASPLAKALTDEPTKGGRVPVRSGLSLPDHPDVFVAGDLSACQNGDGPYPQLAPVAMQQGTHAAKQILRRIQGKEAKPFSYVDRGKMATIGRNAAVAELPDGVNLTGVIAWLAWVFLHIAKLTGFRNRLTVFINWAYNYLTYNRGSRIILNVLPQLDEIKTIKDEDLP